MPAVYIYCLDYLIHHSVFEIHNKVKFIATFNVATPAWSAKSPGAEQTAVLNKLLCIYSSL